MRPLHGGDVAAVAAFYGVDASTLTDFSANIAPGGPPAGVAAVLRDAAGDPRRLAAYPGASYLDLRRAIARKAGVAVEHVIAGHGAAALIDAAVRSARAPAWLVPVPAFSEYRRAVEAAGAAFVAVPLGRGFALDVTSLIRALRDRAGAGVILNTPHNPSGAAHDRSALCAVLEACVALDRPAIFDEAFIDYDPAQSFAQEALGYPRAVVIRSLTKFYALAGVRAGYALASGSGPEALRAAMPSWPVGTLDAAIALAALDDDAYERDTREANARERAWLARAMAACGITVYPSAANFLLIDLELDVKAFDGALHGLIRRGIIVRDCRSFEGLEDRAFIRVAVLGRERNERLATALTAVLRESTGCR